MPLINVKVIDGVFTPEQKTQIVERLTDAMAETPLPLGARLSAPYRQSRLPARNVSRTHAREAASTPRTTKEA